MRAFFDEESGVGRFVLFVVASGFGWLPGDAVAFGGDGRSCPLHGKENDAVRARDGCYLAAGCARKFFGLASNAEGDASAVFGGAFWEGGYLRARRVLAGGI